MNTIKTWYDADMKSINVFEEKGSTHVVIISILSAALLSVVGILFWQNFLQPKPTEKTNSVVVSSEDTKANNSDKEVVSKKDSNEGYLVLDGWNIRFKPTGAAKITYEQKEGNYWFTTETLKTLGGICDTNGGILLTRQAEKSTALASPPIALNKEERIGDYYYYYVAPQSNCSDEYASKEKPEYQVLIDLLQTIEAKK